MTDLVKIKQGRVRKAVPRSSCLFLWNPADTNCSLLFSILLLSPELPLFKENALEYEMSSLLPSQSIKPSTACILSHFSELRSESKLILNLFLGLFRCWMGKSTQQLCYQCFVSLTIYIYIYGIYFINFLFNSGYKLPCPHRNLF